MILYKLFFAEPAKRSSQKGGRIMHDVLRNLSEIRVNEISDDKQLFIKL